MKNIILVMPLGTTTMHPQLCEGIANAFGLKAVVTEEFFFNDETKALSGNLILTPAANSNWAPFGKTLTLDEALKEVGLIK